MPAFLYYKIGDIEYPASGQDPALPPLLDGGFAGRRMRCLPLRLMDPLRRTGCIVRC